MISNGIDLVEIEHFKKIAYKKTVLAKLFTRRELELFQKNGMVLESIAASFASKEAFSKALHFELKDFSFLEIEVLHQEDGSPYFHFLGSLKDKIKEKQFSLSISHDGNYAIAMVVCFSSSFIK